MKVGFIFILMLTNLSAFAGSGALNGGDAVVCKDSVELLDVFEARQMQLTPDFSGHTNLRDMINHVVQRLKEKDLYVANLLSDYSLEMVDDFELFAREPNARGSNVNLGELEITEINDSIHVAIPMGCKLIQLVAQRIPQFSLQFRYTINKNLWDRMDVQNQAMTILHEAWYRIMLDHKAKDSTSARFMNALTASSYIEGISFNQYFNDLKRTELKYYMVVNNSSAIRSPFIKINMAKYILNADEASDQICAPRLIFTSNFMKRGRRLKTSFKNVCFSNSRLTSLKLSSTYATKRFDIKMNKFTLKMQGAYVSNPTIFFHKNGKMKSFKGIQVDSLSFENGKTYKRPNDLSFDINEKPIGNFY